MTNPEIKPGAWIMVGPNHIDARVFRVISPTELVVDHMLTSTKATRSSVILKDGAWQFVSLYDGITLPSGVIGSLARGPFRQ